METAAVIIVEAFKSGIIFFTSKITTCVKLNGNINDLHNELQKLAEKKNEIEDDVRLGSAEGKYPTAQVNGWLKKVQEIEREVQPLLEEGSFVAVSRCSADPTMCRRYQLSKKVAEKCEEVKQLLVESCSFQTVVVERKSPIKAIEKLPAQSLAGQEEAQQKIVQLMELLKDDSVKRIAVWGMGGIGKTTLVKNLNNFMESSSLMESFDLVIWVTVSKESDTRRLQSQIAERLHLEFDSGESIQVRAKRLHRRLMMKKKLLIIFDDVWEKIDLDSIGIPQGDEQAVCKIIVTTRNLDVCRQMMTNADIKLDLLNDEAAWNLFAENAGDVVQSEGINPLAKAIASECCGLPLAITTMGKSMRNKTMIELWRNALWQLQNSTPHVGSFEKDVYLPLKLSYNSLPSKLHQLCFLYCSLYPESFSIETSELIQCWIADGLIDEHQTLEESFNHGIALIENLKDSCMLEEGEGDGTVKMHDILRDLARWMSKESGFFCQSGISLLEIPQTLQKSFTRISFMNNKIGRLPGQLLGYSELTTLLLQGNPLKKIPENFFREVMQLKILNLSCTLITSLPPSLLYLVELRALLLRNCCSLETLPPLGALEKLEMLDLYGTPLQELPEDMCRLSNLRELNLSCTYQLKNIEAGTILGLTSLETLKMSFSAYKWDGRSNVAEKRATFDELLSLERLSALHITLDTVDHLTLDSAWLQRLKKFNIQIRPSSSNSNNLSTQQDEKRLVLKGVDLMGRGFGGLLSNATAIDLVICGGIKELSELDAMNKLCGLPELKSLAISSCLCFRSLVSGDKILENMLPNLEFLTLSRLRNLENIVEGVVSKGGCLSRLKIIEVVNCPRLRNVISFAMLQQLQNLEEIKVGDCRRMKSLIAGKASDAVLQRLRVIEMRNMVNLRTICSRSRTAWQNLERIEVSNCPKLMTLPLSASNAETIGEIKGDMQWWNNLEWEDDKSRNILQRRFIASGVSNALKRQERPEEIGKSSWQAFFRDRFQSPIRW
ncbi:disease resistance family protein [Tripterygium wilfordii]|uniref:Disease resistance family protein n=2 Tax=Tripterygium wilfordii TaxID=458696 RepID=A0A7J7C1I7_TRIWF|nr:disease resistance family protein [Tripterygium wilfordii]